MKDLYEKFAYDYDEFGVIENYIGAEKEFFEKIIQKYNVKSILDCACGTGQHLLMLHNLGLSVKGSDYSDSMLEVARNNLNKNNIDIPLTQCDYRYLETTFDEKFDMVVCLTTAIAHMLTDSDLITALTSMKNRLNENGILVLTQGTTHKTLQLPTIEVIVNRPDFSRVFVKENDGEFFTIHILDLFHSESRTGSNQYDMKTKIILDDDYRRLLKTTGYRNIDIFGDYSMNGYNTESSRLIVVAQK